MYLASLRNPHGEMEIQNAWGEIVRRDTHQCPHCGLHWTHTPGSGAAHALCRRCHDPANKRAGWLCESCSLHGECLAAEQMLDNIEHGRSWHAPRPASAPVTALLWTPESGTEHERQAV